MQFRLDASITKTPMDDATQVQQTNDVMVERDREFFLKEYEALRAEIQNRSKAQAQLLHMNLAAAGVFAVVGLQKSTIDTGSYAISIMLVYPILATFLGMEWLNHHKSIYRIGTYIRETLESSLVSDGCGWQKHIYDAWRVKGKSTSTVPAEGIFLGTQSLIIALAILHPEGYSPQNLILLGVDIVAIHYLYKFGLGIKNDLIRP